MMIDDEVWNEGKILIDDAAEKKLVEREPRL